MTVPADMRRVLRALAGKPCWHVSAGRGTGSTFQLALGAKVPRAKPLANPAQPAAYRKSEGECALMIWCAWRLDGPKGPVVSSDASGEVVDRLLTRALRGRTVERARITVPLAWDLEVSFDRGRCCACSATTCRATRRSTATTRSCCRTANWRWGRGGGGR